MVKGAAEWCAETNVSEQRGDLTDSADDWDLFCPAVKAKFTVLEEKQKRQTHAQFACAFSFFYTHLNVSLLLPEQQAKFQGLLYCTGSPDHSLSPSLSLSL